MRGGGSSRRQRGRSGAQAARQCALRNVAAEGVLPWLDRYGAKGVHLRALTPEQWKKASEMVQSCWARPTNLLASP